MRKIVVLLASMSLAVLLVGGIAWAATISCIEGADRCEGTEEDDTINGSRGGDSILGYGGHDILRGEDGSDSLVGGRGNDKLHGDLASDVLHGGAGNDVMYGEQGPDTLIDTRGRNRLSGSKKEDRVVGSGPLVSGGGSNDFLNLRSHTRTPDDTPGGDIRGGYGDDLLVHEGTGEVSGGSGDDDFDRRYPDTNNSDEDYSGLQRLKGSRTLVGGTGSDSAWLLGRHDDTIHFEGDGRRDVVVSCGRGTDTVYYDGGLDVLKADNGCERRIAR